MNQMKRITTALIPPALVSGVCFLIFAYAAAFSVRQSIVLALIVMFLERYITEQVEKLTKLVDDHERTGKPDHEFFPYYVRIDPRWQQLLRDFHLIHDAEEWDRVKESVYEALPYGISCTILQKPNDDGEGGLIYRGPKHGEFVRALEFRDVIAPIQFEEVPHDLCIFVKPRVDCYDLGIIVPQKWWDRVKTTCPGPLQEESGEKWYTAELTLAKIPYAEFGWYWQPESGVGPGGIFKGDPQYHIYEEWRQKIMSQRERQRVEFGWKECKLWDGSPVRIEHAYFDVQHGRI